MINAVKNSLPKPAESSEIRLITMPEDRLVTALKSGNLSAFNYLYKKYSAALFGSILRIVNQQETAEDILQDVFIKINKNIQLYDERKGKLFTWMLNLSRHAAIDHIRLTASKSRQRSEELEECISRIDNSKHARINTDTIGIKTLLGGLSGKEQRVLDLAYYQGMTHVEIAELLSMPVGTVKTCIRGAILKLRTCFNK